MLSHGMDIQEPPADPEISEILTFIPVDLNKLDAMNKTMRLNVTIPCRTVALVDAAGKRARISRSRLLTLTTDAFVGAARANVT